MEENQPTTELPDPQPSAQEPIVEETKPEPPKPELIGQTFNSTGMTFANVIGLEETKRLLYQKVGMALTNKADYKDYDKNRKMGLLLYGPPGSGKTYICKALAGEFGIPLIIASIPELISEYVGETAKNVAAIFQEVNAIAKENKKGCILFFDEFDAIAPKRGGKNEGEAAALKSALDTLLAEMDGIVERAEDTFIIAATNIPWDLDSAVKRPGRFEDMLYIGLPKLMDRRKLIIMEMRKVKKGIVGISPFRIARATMGWSNADLHKLCEDSKAIAMERRIRVKKEWHTPKQARNAGKITTGLMLYTASKMKAGNPEWFEQANQTLSKMPDKASDVYSPLKDEYNSLNRFELVKKAIKLASLYII